MKIKFEIEWNTGDDEYWDNSPDYEYFIGTYLDIQEYMELTDNQLEELKIDGFVYDEDEDTYCVTDLGFV